MYKAKITLNLKFKTVTEKKESTLVSNGGLNIKKKEKEKEDPPHKWQIWCISPF